MACLSLIRCWCSWWFLLRGHRNPETFTYHYSYLFSIIIFIININPHWPLLLPHHGEQYSTRCAEQWLLADHMGEHLTIPARSHQASELLQTCPHLRQQFMLRAIIWLYEDG